MRVSKTSWMVWGIASFFYAYQYVLRVMPNIMLDDIIKNFHINSTTFGQFSGIYYIGYSLVHLPIGIILDRFGPRYVMSGCILLSVVGLFPIILADHFVYPLIGRFFMGIGSSAAILGAFKIIRITFPEKDFTKMLSFTVSIGLIGAVYGGAPVAYMCASLGYKMVVTIFGVFGIILAGLCFSLTPNTTVSKPKSILFQLKSVLCNPKVLTICLSAGMMVGPLEAFSDVWGSTFLQRTYGFSSKNAGIFTSIIYMGMCVGGPLLSVIAKQKERYLETIMGAGTIMGLIFLSLIKQVFNFESMIVSFAVVGVCCAYQIIAIYKASTYVSEDMSSLATAAANMIIMIFGYVFHTIIGLTMDYFGGVSQKTAWNASMSVIPIMLGVGVLGITFLLFLDKRSKVR